MSIQIANFYRPQTNVLGKVMFLHPCVILFTGGVGFPVCITGHMTRGSASRGVGPPPRDTTGYGQRAGGTHPTGMHSCYSNIRNLFSHSIGPKSILLYNISPIFFFSFLHSEHPCAKNKNRPKPTGRS